VRDDDRFDLRRGDRKRDVVERGDVGLPLKHPAVDEEAPAVRLDQVLAAGDRPRGPDEG
jgi:hypothetical protein